jgi:LPXTG-motif cell wall-anchored protein
MAVPSLINAGIASLATGDIAGGISKIVGGIVGGAVEDTSTTGFTKALNTRPALKWYPTKAEMTLAAFAGGWESHFTNAIQAGYDETTGTWSSTSDDWKGMVVNDAPITAKVYKGASETGTLQSTNNSIQPATSGATSKTMTSVANATSTVSGANLIAKTGGASTVGLVDINSNNNNTFLMLGLLLLALFGLFGKKIMGRR